MGKKKLYLLLFGQMFSDMLTEASLLCDWKLCIIFKKYTAKRKQSPGIY